MTPLHKFRPRWIDRCLYRRKGTFRSLAWAIAILAAAYLLWISADRHQMYHEAAQRISAAEADREMAFEILAGKRVYMTDDGEEVARVTWEKVALVR